MIWCVRGMATGHIDWLVKTVEKGLRQELAQLQVEVNEEKSRLVDLAQGERFGWKRWVCPTEQAQLSTLPKESQSITCKAEPVDSLPACTAPLIWLESIASSIDTSARNSR